jgi:hypothetical protein
MAITKSFLKGLSLTDEQIEAIFEAHGETVNGLKDKIKSVEAEKQKEVDELTEKLESNNTNSTEWEKKYNSLAEEFDTYKADQDKKATISAKTTAYKSLLREAGISDKRMDSIMRVTDLEGITLNKDGSIRDSEKLSETIKEEWADFIVSTNVAGANVPTPPTGKTSMTKAEIFAIKDTKARQKAIEENMELFTN